VFFILRTKILACDAKILALRTKILVVTQNSVLLRMMMLSDDKVRKATRLKT